MDIVPIKKIVTNVMLNMAAKKEEGIATICLSLIHISEPTRR